MRNALVALFLWCCGVASGFNVPIGILEHDDHPMLAENNVQDRDETKNFNMEDDNTGFIVLPFRINKQLAPDLETAENTMTDNDIYEQQKLKQNNVNERSFVYINQKYKTQSMSQYYNPQSDKFPFKRKPVGLSKSFVPDTKETDEKDVRIYFPSETHHTQGEKGDLTKNDNNIGNNNVQSVHKDKDIITNFVELLKPPILRPAPSNQNFEHVATERPIYRKSGPQKNLHGPKFSSDLYQTILEKTYNNYYRYPPQYTQIDPSRFIVDGSNSATENIKPYMSNNIEVNSLVDQYYKKSIEDEIRKERLKAKMTCNMEDCGDKSRKQYISSYIKKSNECLCNRQPSVKLRESNRRFQVYPSTESDIESDMLITPKLDVSDYSNLFSDEVVLKSMLEK